MVGPVITSGSIRSYSFDVPQRTVKTNTINFYWQRQRRFFKTLVQWKEPKLKALESEAYRLFVVRSFESDTNHIIRIEKNGSEIRLIHKQSISPVDSAILVFDKKEKTLSQDQWEKFEKMVYDLMM